jgi:hypothetical protein
MRLCRARRHRFITLPMALSAQPGAPQLYKLRNPIIHNRCPQLVAPLAPLVMLVEFTLFRLGLVALEFGRETSSRTCQT